MDAGLADMPQLKISLARETFSLENSLMAGRVLCAVAGFFGLCLFVSAQQTDRPSTFSALNNNSLRFPSLTLADGAGFSFANMAETAAPDFLPDLTMANVTARSGNDSSKESAAHSTALNAGGKQPVDLQRANLFDYVSGEVGFLYGRSTGKFDREVEAGYIFGETGNDKFSISAGAFYEHSSGRVPRFGR
jgi:hypothetical protein